MSEDIGIDRPSRVLLLMGQTDLLAKDIALSFLQIYTKESGRSNILVDVAMDNFEGLQMFERSQYHYIVVPQNIGAQEDQPIHGIEFIKIAHLICEEESLCPIIFIADVDDDASNSFHLNSNQWLDNMFVKNSDLADQLGRALISTVIKSKHEMNDMFKDISLALVQLQFAVKPPSPTPELEPVLSTLSSYSSLSV